MFGENDKDKPENYVPSGIDINTSGGEVPDKDGPNICKRQREYSPATPDANTRTKKNEEAEKPNEAAILIKLIKNKKTVYDVYKKEKIQDNILAQELFYQGISLASLTQNVPQFGEGVKGKKIIFFPSVHTSEIFVRCLKDRESRTVYISSMKGIGKTYGLALFVFLMRRDPATRILYIHNPNSFINNPYACLKLDLQSAFSKEFEKHPNLKTLLDDLSNTNVDRKNIVETLLNLMISTLKQEEISIYFVIDGYNVLHNHLNSPKVQTDFIRVYPLFLSNPNVERIILMVSVTNEENPQIASEDPLYQFEPSENFPEEMISGFIEHILGGYDLDKPIIAKIREITGDNLRQIDYIGRAADQDRDYFKSDANFNKLKKVLNENAYNDIIKFLDSRHQHSNLRLRNMALLLFAYAHGEPDKTTLDQIRTSYIDRRYIYLGDKIHLLFPGVEDVLRDILYSPTFLNELIETAKDDAGFRGDVLEYAVLEYYACLPKERKGSFNLTKISSSDITQNLMELDLKLERKRFNKLENDTFSQTGLYKPKNFTFPAFDAFIKSTSSSQLIGVQIKLHVKQEHVTFYESGLKGYPNSTFLKADPRSKIAMLRNILDRSDAGNPVLITVFISTEKDLNGDVFKEVEKIANQDKRLKFYHLRVEDILRDIGLSKPKIETLMTGSYKE